MRESSARNRVQSFLFWTIRSRPDPCRHFDNLLGHTCFGDTAGTKALL